MKQQLIKPLMLGSLAFFNVIAPVPMTKSHLVNVKKEIPSICIGLRYADEANITNKQLQNPTDCYLHAETVHKLKQAQNLFQAMGYSLKIWAAYLPTDLQQTVIKASAPHQEFIGDIAKGIGNNRGSAVDVTLVNHVGQELVMPTDFNDFSEQAKCCFNERVTPAIRLRVLLQRTMLACGFIQTTKAWWHFEDKNWSKYPTLNIPFSQLK